MAPRTATPIAVRARALRKAMTEPEIMLWSRLKGRGLDRPIFRRQVAYDSMIFDFYCPAARLVVEIDGATHWGEDKREKDAARDAWLARRGIDVLRVGAGEDLSGVADAAHPGSGADRRRIGSAGGLPSPPPALRRVVPLSRVPRERKGAR
jgi:very-short-patch-repair endonuclease